MVQSAIETLLKQSIGLEAASIGSGTIDSCIRRRMDELGLSDMDSYSALIHTSRDEVDGLIEEVVIPETWFFRNEEAFNVMQQYVSREWRPAHPGAQLRLLSVPCSTGEEPYSLSMALLEAGLRPEEFHVDAVDISRRAIARATDACYSANSFRCNNLSFRQRYFQVTKRGYTLQSSVRDTVRFLHGNLLDQTCMLGLGTYDVIFCRNLLIYFDHSSREKTAKVISNLLKDDGLLFVGHAETGSIWTDLFASARYPKAFAFRKINDDQRVNKTALKGGKANRWPKIKERRRLSPDQRRTPLIPHLKPAAPRSDSPDTEKSKENPGVSLETALELANQNRLEEASKLCEEYLRTKGASGQAYYLLGLINDTQGDKVKAIKYFQKVLYLEPDHYESLVHLALLLEQLGDSDGADRIKHRTSRVFKRQQTPMEESV